jgi:hypothetical protein
LAVRAAIGFDRLEHPDRTHAAVGDDLLAIERIGVHCGFGGIAGVGGHVGCFRVQKGNSLIKDFVR